MPTTDHLDRLAVWFCVMLALAMVHAVTLLVSAKKIDPLPLFPLVGIVLSIQTGIRLSSVWFLWVYDDLPPGPFFWQRWGEMMNPAVLRPLAWLFIALTGHCTIHWLIALRRTLRRKRGKRPTLIVSFCAVANLLITLHVAASMFDSLYLSQKRAMENLLDSGGIEVWKYDDPDAEHPWFRMIFQEVPPY